MATAHVPGGSQPKDPAPVSDASRAELPEVGAGDEVPKLLAGLYGVCFDVTPERQLPGDLDIEALIAMIPAEYTLRGMFFTPLVDQMPERFRELAPALVHPPRLGVYVPFRDYPARDFIRVFDAAARLSHPDCGGREAHRREGREMVEIFTSSKLGKVSMTLLTGPAAALLRYPESFGILSKGPSAHGRQLDPVTVEIELCEFFGSLGCVVGVLEALVMLFGATPAIAVKVGGRGSARIHVSW